MPDELTTLIAPFELDESQSKPIIESFGSLFTEAHKLAVIAKGIKVTDESQTDKMAEAREVRLQLQKVRTDAEKLKTQLKEGYLRGANGIQAIYNDIKKITEPEEAYLKQQEKYAEIKEAERVAKRHTERVSELSKWVDDVTLYNLETMSDEAFSKLVGSSKKAWELEQQAKARAEEERKSREEAERKEQIRIREENERLRKEAQEREAKNRAEREKQQAKLNQEKQKMHELKAKQDEKIRIERERRIALERRMAEDKAKKVAEAKRLEEEKRKALTAPDREKILAIAEYLKATPNPTVKEESSNDLLSEFHVKLVALVRFVEEGAQNL